MNNSDGVFRTIDYLYRLGHRKIGMVKSSFETRNFKERESGFREAMDYFSLPVLENYIVSVTPEIEKGALDMAQWLNEKSCSCGLKAVLPTAFFCMNDIMAYGCVRSLKEKGIRVPGDVSVTGFDDLPSSAYSEPPLTSIRVSTGQIGQRALRKLVERIEKNDNETPVENILISGKLIERKSAASI
jgi:LacI family transcriptional regulator